MKFGLYLPNFGAFGDVRTVVDLARDAEAAGWDGFFLWDHVARPGTLPVVDPWVALAGVAAATEGLRIGTTVTPLPRRRPWKLARETVTLDHLSNGRLTLGVGLGSGSPFEWERLGEETELRRRGAMTDEALEILVGLWSGEPFTFEGEHYRVAESHFLPTPLQSPRIPIWVAVEWPPRRRPLRRAARWDGVFPLLHEAPGDKLERLAEVAKAVREERASDVGFDVVYVSQAPDEDPDAISRAGATWWLDPLLLEIFGSLDVMREVVRRGPPGA